MLAKFMYYKQQNVCWPYIFLIVIACIYVYLHTHIILNVTRSVHTVLLVWDVFRAAHLTLDVTLTTFILTHAKFQFFLEK